MIKKILILTISFLSLIVTPRVFAAVDLPSGKDGFATSYNVLYDVGSDGVTTVTEKINLKNLTSEYYANQFKLTIGAALVFDIKAQDPGGLLAVTQEQKDNSTTINVKFNQQVAGIGKILPWTITFKSKDFAENLGRVWEVRAPKISLTQNIESYNLTLAVPQSFGEPSLISPIPQSQLSYQSKTFLTFDLNQLKTSGISASFGTNQFFDFDLTYHLQNKNLMPILTFIALPPDTSFQDVIYQRIEPKPLNVTLDNDGNYLAWYRLNRGQKIDIQVFGSAKLYTNSKVKNPFLEDTLRKKYTAPDKYWETKNLQITTKLDEILGKDSQLPVSDKAKLIFQFVVNYLKYNPDRLKDNIERLGAATALNNPESAVCMEFTDLFIVLTRAAGIPSRELDGYAYTTNTKLRPLSLNKDVLHAWPEYFDDKRGWVMVDPTWENTTGGADYFNKLDLNHFVFVVKGFSSEDPVPAGLYKYDDKDSHDIKVSLSDTDFLGHPQIDAQIDTLGSIFSGFPAVIRVKITNTGNAFFPSGPLSIQAGKLSIENNSGQKSGVIPAFGTAQFDFNIRTKSLLDTFDDQVVVSVGGQKFTKDLSIRPFILFQTVPLLIVAAISLMALIYLSVLGTLVYRRRVRKGQQG